MAARAQARYSPRTGTFRPTIRGGTMNRIRSKSMASIPVAFAIATLLVASAARGDETCNSPYMAKLIKGQEDYVYVWTLGVEGLGDGSDKLVTVDVDPTRNVLLTSSFTGYANYMRPLGELIKDEAAMKRFGHTMVAWDLKAMKPKTVMQVPGAPLEIRWSLNPGDDWAVTAAALTSKLWLVRPDASGVWQAKEVATIGDPAKIPLPVDISIRRDGKGLWVNTFMDGMTRYFDLSNPQAPKQTYEKHTGAQVNMISQSWDGTRVYITSSLLANWDKAGADNEQFLRGFRWDGKELTPAFEVDFTREKLRRP